ncbi:MAG TPA: hydroxyethylthiazole kinase [Patescibacteria group bacterium]|nr:hydroxyethylthiazole kinase [Patescibacteria group bacterium]
MEACTKITELLLRLREKKPLIHHITNYVTANDCANITLAIGASPVMADDINEVKDITTMSSALALNLGTLNEQRLGSMLTAAQKANELSIPIILDPVGVGATTFRLEAATRIISEVRLSVIRGNLSEIKALYGLNSKSKGVDTAEILGTNHSGDLEAAYVARALACELNASVAITGAIDLITNGKTLFKVENGHPLMSRVTGTGCMCTSLIASYLGAGGDSLTAALAGVVSMGIAGDIACERLDKSFQGTGSLKVYIHDAIYLLSPDNIVKRGKIVEI